MPTNPQLMVPPTWFLPLQGETMHNVMSVPHNVSCRMLPIWHVATDGMEMCFQCAMRSRDPDFEWAKKTLMTGDGTKCRDQEAVLTEQGGAFDLDVTTCLLTRNIKKRDFCPCLLAVGPTSFCYVLSEFSFVLNRVVLCWTVFDR